MANARVIDEDLPNEEAAVARASRRALPSTLASLALLARDTALGLSGLSLGLGPAAS
jgi:hypothetical protein